MQPWCNDSLNYGETLIQTIKNAVLNLNQAKALNDIIRKHYKDECHMVLAQIIHEKSLELFLENPTRCFYKYFEIEISKLRDKERRTMKRLTPEAYRMHEFLLEYCVGEDNAMHALELGAWIGLSSKSAQRQVRKLREEINSNVSEIQRKVLTSDKGYYVACAEEAIEPI